MPTGTSARRLFGKLSARFVESSKAVARHSDGGGLYLVIRPSGARSWSFKYKRHGKAHEMGLGAYDQRDNDGLSLARAREKASEARASLRSGKDPLGEKRAAKVARPELIPTFGAYADQYLKTIRPSFKSTKTGKDWERGIQIHAAALRPIPVSDITPDNLISILEPLWLVKHKTARELRNKIEKILDAAKVSGHWSGDNPARWTKNLEFYFKAKKNKSTHHAAPHYDEMRTIIRRVRELQEHARTSAALALEFTILTAVRTTETLAMKAAEVDFQRLQWCIPAIRMKAEVDHIVPLADRAVDILRQRITSETLPTDFVFAGLKPAQRLGQNAMLHVLQSVSPGMTTHGCRSTFRDWAGDCTEHAWEIAEAALAHAVGSDVARAYRRGNALEKRRQLMSDWSTYIEPI